MSIEALHRRLYAQGAEFRARWERAARTGLDAVLPHPRRGLIIVGGPRNPGGELPAGTRAGLVAAFRAIERTQLEIDQHWREQ